MSSNFDYKKEWEKTKKQLIKFGKEASVLAKKGEEEDSSKPEGTVN